MSLGFARDSILDLASMANEHEGSNGNDGSSSRSSFQGDSDSQPRTPIALTQKKNVYFSSTQEHLVSTQSAGEVGLVLGGPPGQKAAPATELSSAAQSSGASTSSVVNEAGSDAASSTGQSTDQTAYSAFAYDYSAYGDYYEEADAWMGGGSGYNGGIGADKNSEKKNIFCCLFPWLPHPVLVDSDEEDSHGSSNDSDIGRNVMASGEAGAEKSCSDLAEHNEQEDSKYRGSLEVNDSVSLAKAKELGLVNHDEGQSVAPSVVSDLFHAEEKKGDEEGYGSSSAAVSTDARGSAKSGAAHLAQAASSSIITDDDDVTSHTSGASGDTDVYGEKLTDKDRQAVMARLRLSVSENANPPPEVSTSGDSSSAEVKGSQTAATVPQTKQLDGSTITAAAADVPSNDKKIKGILKHTVKMASQESLQNASNFTASNAAALQGKVGSPDRRSLFPSYASRRQVHPDPSGHDGLLSPESKKSLNFSPMARVVSVPSRHDMSFVDKAGVWWQRSDYDDFKKTGRIIAKAMLQGGSEIWMSSNNAWEKRAQKNKVAQDRSPEYDEALRKYVGEQHAGLDPAEEASAEDYGSKWWCKFGHSRRGLEHIASMDEGRHRQRNVNSAMRHILDEQRSQRLNHRRDPVKLAKVALQYTSWARDLALAAGASDADAVRTNFSPNAKDRGHYLRHGVGSAGTSTGAGESSVGPGHSRAVSDVHKIAPEILDANTSTHIYLQNKDAQEAAAAAAAAPSAIVNNIAPASIPQELKEEAKKESLPMTSGGVTEKEKVIPQDIEEGYTTPDEGFSGVGQEAIHDPDAFHEAIAKQAAGFDQHAEEQHERGVDIAFIHKKEAAVGAS